MKLSLHTALNVVRPEAYGGWEGWLNGPCGDAQSLASELALAGWHTQSLINDAATVSAYAEKIEVLAGETREGDTVLLHHSHHGARMDNGVFGGYQETFCLSDGELIDVKWLELLAKFQPGVSVVAVLDCCHSGGMDRIGRGAKVRPSLIRPAVKTWPTIRGTPVRANVVILPACHAEETCIETMIHEIAEVRGAWTWSLVRELQHQRGIQGRTLLPELYNSARLHCAEKFPNQHPRVCRLGPTPETAWQTRIA